MNSNDVAKRVAVSKALQIVNLFRDQDTGANDLTCAEMATFLLIAEKPEATLQEIADEAGIVLTTASRHAQALGEFDRRHNPGKELIRETVDVMNRRRKIRTLTPKGQRIINRIQEIIGG